MRKRMFVPVGVALLAATLAVGSLTAAFAQAPGGPGSGPMMGGMRQHGMAQPLRSAPNAQMGPMMGAPLEQLSGDEFDKAFLMQMSMHHAMAVMMAKPVVANATHPEMKDLGSQIVADQTREIAQMRAWAKDWYGMDIPDHLAMMDGMGGGQMPMGGPMPMGGHEGHGGMMGEMHPGMMGEMSMMADLWKLPPKRLEAVFMSMMVPHHEGAIGMARLVPERAVHQELKDMAGQIISSQAAEIGQMNAWLAGWYGL